MNARMKRIATAVFLFILSSVTTLELKKFSIKCMHLALGPKSLVQLDTIN